MWGFMATNYRVIDARGTVIQAEQTVTASSPEDAARQVFGSELARSGKRDNLVARVYWQLPDAPKNMVRLYTKSAFAS